MTLEELLHIEQHLLRNGKKSHWAKELHRRIHSWDWEHPRSLPSFRNKVAVGKPVVGLNPLRTTNALIQARKTSTSTEVCLEFRCGQNAAKLRQGCVWQILPKPPPPPPSPSHWSEASSHEWFSPVPLDPKDGPHRKPKEHLRAIYPSNKKEAALPLPILHISPSSGALYQNKMLRHVYEEDAAILGQALPIEQLLVRSTGTRYPNPGPDRRYQSGKKGRRDMRFKTCRLLSGNVQNRELTIIQRRVLRRLRNKKRYIKRKISPRKNMNSYIQSQTTRKLPLFHADLPITEMHRGTERTSYIPFILNPETRSDVIPVRLHFRETIPQARKRRIKRIELPTHYSEVNHRTPKAVVFYGPNVGHIPHDIRLKDPNLPLRSGNGRGQNI
ncbi:hypothetical protein DEO72_LG1g2702 [Vigna unguiculata]|uniref:Uncharacterized protein n=1 Tax=Vigna unguiculata TaxID=3917 RepID=A0A4D6KYR9_VIGUN|nr:hypothetical protein DEO72_LG1g2702 [Vigna unguiculata]